MVLERETYDAGKRVELLNSIHESFSSHLNVLEGINPKGWEGLDINKELTKSLSIVDGIRRTAEIFRCAAQDQLEQGTRWLAIRSPPAWSYQADYGTQPPEQKDFIYWLKAGFAFTLPILALGILLIVVLVAVFNK